MFRHRRGRRHHGGTADLTLAARLMLTQPLCLSHPLLLQAIHDGAQLGSGVAIPHSEEDDARRAPKVNLARSETHGSR
ncbi:hypothetical protein, unknown function [Leishmania tarentolae]|uniref:Uncharacterized protein n=1 Tax=Leishmania tarentolae TaxID=5689 RepID=A0A640KQ87_LEITA|nr:hypothetical protein, unknown function [Leishmania tarentolae]